MKIVFYDAKPYDIEWFNKANEKYGFDIRYLEYKLNHETAVMAGGADAVCAFVNDSIDKDTIDALHGMGIKIIAMRCAGYNNVDFKQAYKKIHVVRVKSYSPHAVAEHAVALMMTLNRKIHRAYNRTRENNFAINGLLGFDFSGKTAGVIGTGRIGRVFAGICKGLGMEVLGYDKYPDTRLDIRYTGLDELYAKSDVISLHCPLTGETRHMINDESIARMKPGVMIINTSRGGVIDTEALIRGLKDRVVSSAGLDVYEEESDVFFEDFSNDIINDDLLARLLTFPNVIVTSHQAFFTQEALDMISSITLENLKAYEQGRPLENEICYKCLGGECERKENGKCF